MRHQNHEKNEAIGVSIMPHPFVNWQRKHHIFLMSTHHSMFEPGNASGFKPAIAGAYSISCHRAFHARMRSVSQQLASELTRTPLLQETNGWLVWCVPDTFWVMSMCWSTQQIYLWCLLHRGPPFSPWLTRHDSHFSTRPHDGGGQPFTANFTSTARGGLP